MKRYVDNTDHETTGTIVHKDTKLLVGAPTISAHVEDDILQTGSLRNLPVNSSTVGEWHASKINVEVSDLTEKVVLVGKPIDSTILIWVGINDSHASEVGSGLDGWNVESITDHVGVVVLLQWSADHVRSWWKVNQSRGDSRRVATLSAAVAGSNGAIDGGSVVAGAIALGAEILDIAVNLVVWVTISNLSLASDLGEPVITWSSGRKRLAVLRRVWRGRDEEDEDCKE